MRTINVSVTTLHNIALSLAIFLVTVAWATTTLESYDFFINFRNYALIPVVSILMLFFVIRRRSRESYLAISICLILLVLSSVNGQQQIGQLFAFRDILMCFIVNVVFLILLAGQREFIISEDVVKFYLVGSGVIFCYTVYAGGIVFEGGVRFIYSYLEEGLGVYASYSQGISKFYGLSAVFAFLYLRGAGRGRYFVGVAVFFFLLISFLGGGRGDFLSAMLTIIIFSKLRPRYMIFLVIFVIALIYSDGGGGGNVEAVAPVFNRYHLMFGDAGYRDVLASQSLQLLAREPQCLVMGCGIGFFQSYWGYPSGMYPHNLILEFIISFGVVITLVLMALFLIGCMVLYKKEGRESYFLAFTFFFLMIGLKSGGLLTSWITTSCVLFLASIGIFKLLGDNYRWRKNEREI